jgi:hypothetical protein
MNDIAQVSLGAALVTIGVLVAALADRIRGFRVARETLRGRKVRAGRAHAGAEVLPVIEATEWLHAEPATTKPMRASRPEPRSNSTPPGTDGANDVIAALVGAGYKKAIATESTRACSMAERATVEEWTRAALRAARGRCPREGMS